MQFKLRLETRIIIYYFVFFFYGISKRLFIIWRTFSIIASFFFQALWVTWIFPGPMCYMDILIIQRALLQYFLLFINNSHWMSSVISLQFAFIWQALSCALCVSMGLVMGYSIRSPSVDGTQRSPPSPPAPSVTPTAGSFRHFGGRDFTEATAVKFQSFLTSQMVNAYARWVNESVLGE